MRSLVQGKEELQQGDYGTRRREQNRDFFSGPQIQ